MQHERKLSRARTALLIDQPWFGMLAMRLQFKAAPDRTPTMATDGTHLYYAPAFIEKIPDAHLQGVIAHEVMHCALLHPYRRAGRDPQDWNRATDYAINAELRRAGFLLPADVLYDAQFEALSADTIYARIHGQKPDPNGKQKQDQPLSTGEVQDAPAPSDGDGDGQGDGEGDGADQQGQGQGQGKTPRPMSAQEWQIASEQATRATRGAGQDPGGAARAAKAAGRPRDDWRAILREFITQSQTPSDYTWTRPNRRHVHNGLYLPGIHKESLGRVIVAIDTSGSIGRRDLEEFGAELQAVAADAKPEAVEVVYCDTRVQRIDRFEDGEPVEIEAIGGGGTLYSPVFEHTDKDDEPPVCLIYCTDLEPCEEYPAEPGYPVLWLTPERITETAPYGRTVRMAAR